MSILLVLSNLISRYFQKERRKKAIEGKEGKKVNEAQF